VAEPTDKPGETTAAGADDGGRSEGAPGARGEVPTPGGDDGGTLAKKSGLYAVGEAVLGASQLVTAIVLTHAVDKTSFAQISLVILLYSSAIAIGGFNLHHSIFYFFQRLDSPGQRRFMLQTAQILVGAAGLAAAILLVVGALGGDWGYQLEGRMWKLGLVVLFELPTLPMAFLLLARGRAGGAAAVNLVTGVAQMVAIVVPMVLGLGIDVVLYALIGYALTRALVYVAVLARLVPGPAAPPSWTLAKAQISYTLPLGFAMLTGMLNRQIDKYLVAAFCPQTDFAVYVVGAQEVPLVTVLPYSVGAVLMTRFVSGYADGDTDSLLRLWHQAISKVALVVVPLVAIFLIVGEDLIAAIFGGQYREAQLPFRLYTVILLHRVAEYGLVLRAAADTRSLWYASCVLLGCNVVLSVPLVLLMGMPGPALATLLANIPAWLYVLRRIGRVLGVGMGEAFPWRRYGATVLLAGAASGASSALYFGAGLGAPLDVLVSLAAFVGVYLGAGRLTGVIAGADFRWLWDMARRAASSGPAAEREVIVEAPAEDER
jgi:O-antigen/teichoic acid export membrane protein